MPVSSGETVSDVDPLVFSLNAPNIYQGFCVFCVTSDVEAL